jgi:putative transposase
MHSDENDLIDAKLKGERDPKVRDRLRMMLLLKEGYKPKEVATIMRTTERTVYTWKKRYREEGCEGLKTRERSGRKTRLSDEDTELLTRLLKQKGYWTTRDVRALIKSEFGVEFTMRHVARLLRKTGMSYQKPYVTDLKRPKDAEEILKKD